MKDLVKLYSFYSVHNTDDEKSICDWLVNRLTDLGVKDIQRKDNTIWHFKDGNRVLLSAHLDQVATNGPVAHLYKDSKGIIKGYNKDWQRTSLGADDKNGIWCILKLIEDEFDIDFIISEGEEVGCVGILSIEEHIKDSTADIAIVIDRKGNTDILKGGGSDVYCDTLAGVLRNYWNSYEDNSYVVTTGSISDTKVICKHIESVNLCANYEGAHTKNETTDFNALQNTLSNLEMLLTEIMSEVFVYYPTPPDVYVKKEVSYYSGKYHYDYSDYDNDEYWFKGDKHGRKY